MTSGLENEGRRCGNSSDRLAYRTPTMAMRRSPFTGIGLLLARQGYGVSESRDSKYLALHHLWGCLLW